MPIPVPPPGWPAHPETRVWSYYLRDPQSWAVEQERQRHSQAIYQVGEWTMFLLMWHVVDEHAGLVTRCSRCYPTDATDRDRRIAEVYDQPRQNKCDTCFGTTFEGGYRARIVRPAIIADSHEDEKVDRRGVVHPDEISVESTSDFRLRHGDFVVRADNSRWRVNTPQRVTVRTGFDHPTQAESQIAYNNVRAAFEEPTTVAYQIPPIERATVRTILTRRMRIPADAAFAPNEDIRGPLVPISLQD